MGESGEHEQFFSKVKLLAAVTMVSRVLGLVRDMVIVPLGGDRLADRFWTAFSIPNLLRRLFGEGALSAAFVPVFTQVAEAQGRGRARLVLANVAGLLAVLLAGIVLLTWAGLAAAWLLWPGGPLRLLLLRLIALMMPFLITICLLALGAAALNCRGHFAYPAFAPVLLNVVLIAAALWVAPALAEGAAGQFHVLAVALVLAGAVQLAGVVWVLRAADLAVVPRLRPVLPEVRRVARLMAPMLVPLGAMQATALADRVIALALTRSAAHPDLPVTPGAVRCLYAAGRLYQLPLGVLAASIATAVFPLLGRYAARDDLPGLRETLNRALRMGAFVALPAGVGLILLAEPTIALIFQRKEFGPADTARTVLLLRLYCLGMCAYFWTPVLLRAFFSRQDARAPMVLAVILAVVNVALVLGLVWTPLKAGAIALATAVTQTANALVLIFVLRRRWGRLGGRRVLASFARTAAATAAMAAAVLAVLHVLPGQLAAIGPTLRRLAARYGLPELLIAAGPTLCRLAVVAAGVGAGAAVYLLAARLLGMRELGELLGGRRRSGENTEHE